MSISPIPFERLQPDFSELLNGHYSSSSAYRALQPEFADAMDFFCKQSFSNLMLVQAPFFIEAQEWLNDFFQPQPKSITVYSIDESRTRVLQIDDLDKLNPTDKVMDPNPRSEIIVAEHVDRETLFGRCAPELVHGSLTNSLERYRPGLIWQANHGILVLPVAHMLAQPSLWLEVYQCLCTGQFDWRFVQQWPDNLNLPNAPVQLKVLLWGNAQELDDIIETYPKLWIKSACKCELKEEVPATLEYSQAWLEAFFDQVQHHDEISADVQNWLLQQASKHSEHNHYLALDFYALKQLFLFCKIHYGEITQDNLRQAYHQQQSYRSNECQWSRRSYQDRQVKIDLQGKEIGQINGLSVLESPGLSHPFGEPLRITATVHPGDGDLADVERKAELAGNIHAKSMMIIHGFLTRQFARDGHLPISGTLVFEQSYHEIDGDSASLAGLITILSALSNLPVDQSFATTGAIDQMGNVLAVGGVNEKIDGFYQVCQLLDPEHTHSVIIPKANMLQLNLSEEIIDAVQQSRLYIYPVEHVTQAIELLLCSPIRSSLSGNELLELIEQRSQTFYQLERDDQIIHRWMRSLKQTLKKLVG
ncbi:MAG: Lon protease [Candidatus Celerinatantimonas neptuna]|nr:MAG: Lon protease [Candidatus Celerinatantimonas neptuna]